MIGALKRLAPSAARISGASALARRLTAEWPRIVVYHNFCGEPHALHRTSMRLFRQQMMHLKRHYRPVRLRDLGRQLADGVVPPAGSVAITVDDGHANFLRFA